LSWRNGIADVLLSFKEEKYVRQRPTN
jgi:hypothetical protein